MSVSPSDGSRSGYGYVPLPTEQGVNHNRRAPTEQIRYTEHMNDSIEFPTPQEAIDWWRNTHTRSAKNNKITPPLKLELSRTGNRVRFNQKHRNTLEEIWNAH